MWCRNCNIETNDTICPVCSETTVEDIPIEIYWCVHCKTPIIQNVTQADKGICPSCGEKIIIYQRILDQYFQKRGCY